MKTTLLSLAVALAFSTAAARADNYALIMGVSDYPSSPLPGIPKDIENAQLIAEAMDIPAGNITVRRDGQLTLAGLRQTLGDFSHKIKPGDRVFIYFSGHGRSYSKTEGQCDKAIVTREGEAFSRDEFQRQIDPIIHRAAKTFVFLDTCFSGGVVASSKGGSRGDDSDSVARIKAFQKPGDPCAQASNVEYAAKGARDFDTEASSTPNYYLLGAAGPTEYAIDGGQGVGSLATTGFQRCLQAGTDSDQNNDGVVTLNEAYQCAQRQVNAMLPAQYSSQTLTEGNGPGGNTPVAFDVEGSAPVSARNTANTASTRIDSQNLMETITQAADPEHRVTVTPTQASFQIGNDFLEMDVSSSKSGYLTILSVGSSGTIYQLFPNQHDRDNKIEANQTLRLPRPAWRIRAKGPSGRDRFLAIVSGTPDRFNGFGVPVSPFSKVENNMAGAKDIIERLVTPSQGCKSAKAGQRDFETLAAMPPCSSGYGAGSADVQEVD